MVLRAQYSDGGSRTKKLSVGCCKTSPPLGIFYFLNEWLTGHCGCSSCFAEIERIQKGEIKKEPEKETYLDLFATKNLKLKERVLIPTKQYPRVSVLCFSWGLDHVQKKM